MNTTVGLLDFTVIDEIAGDLDFGKSAGKGHYTRLQHDWTRDGEAEIEFGHQHVVTWMTNGEKEAAIEHYDERSFGHVTRLSYGVNTTADKMERIGTAIAQAWKEHLDRKDSGSTLFAQNRVMGNEYSCKCLLNTV